jgi:hypothetical protein
MDTQMSNQDQKDNGKRGNTGIVTSFHRLEGGKIRLVLDDVRQMPMLDASGWLHQRMYTWAEFDQEKFKGLELSKDDLLQLAENLVIRLVALEKGDIPREGYNIT